MLELAEKDRDPVFELDLRRSRFHSKCDACAAASDDVIAMLRHVGFEVLHLWGGTAGEWGRRPLKLDEVEMMAVCRKP